MGYQAPGASSNRLQLVEETVISGAAVQNSDFSTVLAGDTDGYYMVTGTIVNDDGSANQIIPRLNGASIACNHQKQIATGTSMTAARSTDVHMIGCTAGHHGHFVFWIPKTETGTERCIIYNASRNDDANIRNDFGTMQINTPTTATEITSIGIGTNVTSGIGVGSVIRLWRKI